jgi:hypothetical protein
MSKYLEICPISTLTRFFHEESSLATRYDPDKRVRFNARAGDVLAFIRKVHGATRCNFWIQHDGRIHMQHEGDEYTCGYIRVTGNDVDDKPTYQVWAPSIENNKYNPHGELHNTKSSTNIETAVRNVKRHAIPLTLTEKRHLHLNTYRHKIKDNQGKLSQKYADSLSKIGMDSRDSYKAWRSTFTTPALLDQLTLAVKLDSFDFGSLKDDINAAIDALADVEAERRLMGRRDVKFVRVSDSAVGDQKFEILPLPHTDDDWRTNPITDEVPTVLTGSECVPEHMIQKLSVLTTVGGDEYVRGVGFRTHVPNLFFVEEVLDVE